jgi:hypothetical protein
MIRKHFRLKRIALGLAFAAVALPATASATPYVSNSDRGVPQVQSSSYLSTQVSPYELGPGQATRVLPGSMTMSHQVVRSQKVTAPASNGFDWSGPIIGVSVAFAAALVLLTALNFRRHRDRTGLARA